MNSSGTERLQCNALYHAGRGVVGPTPAHRVFSILHMLSRTLDLQMDV
jgi:hypothetical protein